MSDQVAVGTESAKLLVIVPTYNERDNLPKLLARMAAQPMPIDILVVDDNSQDGTGAFADQIAKENPSVHVLHRATKDGLGRAYISGFQWALERDYDFVMEMDADLSHAPEAIPAFVEAANDADLVLGTRYRAGIRVINWPVSRIL